jgi:hypothetical protein
MKRRKAVSTLLWGIGGVILAPDILLSSCNSKNDPKQFLTEEDILLLNDIGETIIPATASSKGAGETGIGEFMKVYVTDCYSKERQDVFKKGLAQLRGRSKDKYGKEFLKLSKAQKHELLAAIDKEAKDHDSKKDRNVPGHYFSMIKEITVFGYFTSEPGATEALRYVQTPGSYDGNVDYKPGDKAWAL